MTRPTGSTPRLPHASVDVESRRSKAMKIERLLYPLPIRRPLRLLEIGTGSGVIAHYFATHPDLDCVVSAVDVIDQRVETAGYEFRLVADTQLPFGDGTFEVVLSNHVIEHVGDAKTQLTHLSEMRRVLTSDGCGYLATPNRWALVEPHYRLPLLSWMPQAWRRAYVRLTGRGEGYDCEPLSLRDLDAMLGEAHLAFRHIEVEAVTAAVDIGEERPLAGRLAQTMPDWMIGILRTNVPTFVCRLEPSG